VPPRCRDTSGGAPAVAVRGAAPAFRPGDC
jgi:hypothetical protein